jgi:hypothetical protein
VAAGGGAGMNKEVKELTIRALEAALAMFAINGPEENQRGYNSYWEKFGEFELLLRELKDK